jgi:hypothetical protein
VIFSYSQSWRCCSKGIGFKTGAIKRNTTTQLLAIPKMVRTTEGLLEQVCGVWRGSGLQHHRLLTLFFPALSQVLFDQATYSAGRKMTPSQLHWLSHRTLKHIFLWQ